MGNVRFVGFDVHAETIAVAVADSTRNGEVVSLGTIPNRPEPIAKLLRKLGRPEDLRVCYEAGPCGFVVYWQLAKLGVHCEVIAPGLVPVKPGDRIKTDRRDAEKLARCYRNGDLTPVWVPDANTEALRDLLRAREAANQDHVRAVNRLRKLLLRRGIRPPEEMKNKTSSQKYLDWTKTVRFEQSGLEATRLDYISEVEHMRGRIARLEEAIDDAVNAAPASMRDVIQALQALRGIRKVVAATIVAELGQVSRFATAPQLMSYAGAVPSEHSSGGTASRGRITKTGNSHLRRVIVESAWAYRYKPNLGPDLRRRQKGLSKEVTEIAWKAQHRLHRRYYRLLAKGKTKQTAVTAVAREFLGFIWAIAVHVEKAHATA